MALILCRITDPYECVRCDITRKIISYGEEYFLDTIDGTIIDFNFYHDTKWAKKKEEGMQKAEEYLGILDYRQALFQKQREFLRETMLDRKQLGEIGNWDVDYSTLGIHDSQEAQKIKDSIINKTPTKNGGGI